MLSTAISSAIRFSRRSNSADSLRRVQPKVAIASCTALTWGMLFSV